MGYKNEIEQKKPRLKTPFLKYILDPKNASPNLIPGILETPKTIALNYYTSTGKALPIYVNNFTNALPYRQLFVIFYREMGTVKQMLFGICGWFILTLQKSTVYGLSGIMDDQMIPARPLPIYINMNIFSNNKNISFKITNNPIGGYLCPSGMDGRN
jgi:hypothetical protein